jgi:hypothetical protein
MANRDITIYTYQLADKTFRSATSPQSQPFKHYDALKWLVAPLNGDKANLLPADADVELRFADGAVLGKKGKKVAKSGGKGNRAISFFASADAEEKVRYAYEIWYRVDDEYYLLEDPELVIEGEQVSEVRSIRPAQKRRPAKKR